MTDDMIIMNASDIDTEKLLFMYVYYKKCSVNILELSRVYSICDGFLSPWLTCTG